jgi:hypothetical protein
VVTAAQISTPEVPAPASDRPAAGASQAADSAVVSAASYSVLDLFSKP